jgi:putative ABC transport system substrate-binding protein
MLRREFITLLGGAAASWPFAARAQQSGLPVVGILGATEPDRSERYVAAIRNGLKGAGYLDGQNLAIEYRWADGQYDRLPVLAAELAHRRVAVIVPIGGAPSTIAAKSVTTTIPIVFNMGADPVALGLVASMNRPGGNLTGVGMMVLEIEAKRLELLSELVPNAAPIAVVVNPSNAQAETQSRAFQAAARSLKRSIVIFHATTRTEIESAFAALVHQHASALLIGGDTFFGREQDLFIELAGRNRIPASYVFRDFVEQGGLMSYGPAIEDAYRQVGIYVGRVLKGEKPANLPVVQPTKFEFVLNVKTAKALGLDVPASMLVRADEVIE